MLAVMPLCACSDGQSYTWRLSSADNANIHTDAQAEYIASENYASISVDGTSEQSRPRPLRLEWEFDGDCRNYTVELTHTGDFADAVSYDVEFAPVNGGDAPVNYIDVYNLYVGAVYEWHVTAELSDGSRSVSGSEYFITNEQAPRNIYIDGVTNMRDLGGWNTADGGQVKQGLLYRCGRLNKSKQPEVEIEITQDGITAMRDVLGIKSEIDFRMPDAHNTETGGITSSPLGDDVKYYNVPMEWDELLDSTEAVKKMFSILGDESNYPAIFHCDIGTDRTGMFAFLINGLLGVSEEDLYRDYMFSNFADIGGKRTLDSIRNSYVKTVKSCSGDTLAEKIRNCLIGIGVAADDIDTLVSKMK